VRASTDTTSGGDVTMPNVGVVDMPTAGRRIPWSERDIALLLRVGDCMAILLAGMLAYYTRFFPFGEHHPALETYALVVGTVVAPEVFHLFGLYDNHKQFNFRISASRVAGAWGTVVLLLLALAFLTQTAQTASRLWVIFWFAYGIVGLLAGRALLCRKIARWQQAGHFTRKVAIFGAGELGQRLVEAIRRVSGSSVQIVGVFDDRKTRIPNRVGDVAVIGTREELARFARAGLIDQVVITLPALAEQRILSVLSKLRELPVEVSLCPVVFEPQALLCRRATLVDGVPLLELLQRPFSRWGYLVKTLEDYVLAALLLIPASPLMLMIAMAVRLDSRGPVLFRQERYGFNNRTIQVLKFRTMRTELGGDSQDQALQATRHDPRFTRVGRWLRRTSLDELPQLLNVLQGEMSIVGPRPHMVAHNVQYASLIDTYLGRHRVKPGITGWAQVNGLRGETDTLEKMEGRIRHDLYYIEHWSLGFDLWILARTLLVGFVHRNAY
jgi:Undecaprenyl-phosphate glucose phosphotransferase